MSDTGADIVRFSTPDPVEGDPLPFKLEVIHLMREEAQRPDDAGEDWQPHEVVRKERREHDFHAVPDLSGGVLVQIDLMAAGARGQGGVNVRGGDALFDFYDAMLVPEDRTRFLGLVRDKDVYVHQQVLTDIALHFYRVYSAHPTKRRDA